MARITKAELQKCLGDAGCEFFEVLMPEGGSAILTSRGARILGLFPGAGSKARNALWTNERLDAVVRGELRDWEGEGTGGTGGERLWVSPERSFYYRRPETFEGWFCPQAMDPGQYHYVSEAGGVGFANTFDLEDVRAGRTYRNVHIKRRFEILGNPCANIDGDVAVASRLKYAGVRKTDSIELPDAPADAQINLWTLALVDPLAPDGVGTAVIPVRPSAQPVDYFGGLTDERLVVRSDHVAFRIDCRAIAKLGIRPEDLAQEGVAQIAAFLPSGGDERLLLVIQRSSDIPRSQAECLDEAKANPDGPKGAVQTYNNGPGPDADAPFARFGEIEIQLAAARPCEGGTSMTATAVSELMAFEGARDDILALGRAMLEVDEIQLFSYGNAGKSG